MPQVQSWLWLRRHGVWTSLKLSAKVHLSVYILQAGKTYGDVSCLSKLLSWTLQLLTAAFWFGSRASGQCAAAAIQQTCSKEQERYDCTQTFKHKFTPGSDGAAVHYHAELQHTFQVKLNKHLLSVKLYCSYNMSWIYYPWCLPLR